MARLLGDDPGAACTWWRGVEQRFAGWRDWVRARELTGLLLEAHDPEAAADPASAQSDPLPDAVAGYVRATYAATLGQVSPTADTATEWAAVEAWVEEHPDAPGAALLRLRARAGAIAGTPAPLALIGEEAIAGLVEAVRGVPQGEFGETLAAGPIAAMAVIAELARRELAALPAFAELLEAVLGANLSAPLEAFMRSLRARVQLRSGRPEDAWAEFEGAIALQRPKATRASWMDWRAPDDIGSRVRLELAAAGYEPGRTLAAVGPTNAVPRSTLEGRWLRSAIVMLELYREWKPLDAFGDAEATTAIDEPVAKVHTVIPPLCLSAAYAVTAGGCAEDALDTLAVIRRRAERDSAQLAVHWTDLLTLGLHARMRLRDDRLGAATIGRQAASRREQELLWQLDGLDGAKASSLFAPSRASERPSYGQQWPAWRHARWRALYTHGSQRARDAVAWAALALAHERHAPSRESLPVLACALDAIEANLVSERVGMPHPCRGTFEPSDVALAITASERGEPAAAFEVLLRCAVLTGDTDAARAVPSLAERIGVRRAGLIALTETELLALRLPGRAIEMLEQAVEWLSAARDPVNLFLATTLGALTLVRAGDDDQAQVWIDRLESRCGKLQALAAPACRPGTNLSRDRTAPGCRAARRARAARVAAVAGARRRAARLAAARGGARSATDRRMGHAALWTPGSGDHDDA